jgi:hypothetical protein
VGTSPGAAVQSAVADDWRVTVKFSDVTHARKAARAIREHHLDAEVRRRQGTSVVVSADGPAVFLYADSEDTAREADRIVREVLIQHQLTDDGFALDRWHPDEQEWQDASIPMPDRDEGQAAGYQDLVDDQAQQSAAAVQARWEVRVELPSRHQAIEITRRLQAEGHPVFRRGKYLIVGAASEDEASALSQSIRQQAQVNASVPFHAEPFAHFEIRQPGTGEAPYYRID